MALNCCVCGKRITFMDSRMTLDCEKPGSVLCEKCFRYISSDVLAEDARQYFELLYKENGDIDSEIKNAIEREIIKVHEEKNVNEKEDQQEDSQDKELESTIDKKNIIVTTGDLKREYEIIGPVYFQVSNKGVFGSTLSRLVAQYRNEIIAMKNNGTMSQEKSDWGFLYGEWSVGQNDFEKAFYVATEELKKRANMLGADAIICMRQDIDLDTNAFQFFYLQMYGTAVKFI